MCHPHQNNIFTVPLTFNIYGVYNEKDEKVETYPKVRIMFSFKDLFFIADDHICLSDRYDLMSLIDLCESWLNRNYPGYEINCEEFDLRRSDEFENPDNLYDIISAP